MIHVTHERACPCLIRRAVMCCLLVISIGLSCAAYAADAQEYKVSINSRSITIAGVFSEIRKQTGLHVFYNNDLLNDKEKVNVQFSGAQVEKVLTAILQGKNLQFSITDNYVVIFSPKEKGGAAAQFLNHLGADAYADTAKARKVNGRITGEEDGAPLIGAAVTVLQTKRGTTSNANGEFSIDLRPGDSLSVSYIGKAAKNVVYRSQAVLALTLANSDDNNSEVVVTGFQRIEKKKFTGATVKLSAEDVKVDGMIDVSRMLEGKAAGVSIQNVSGTFGAAPKVRIRGATSISGDNKPLWVVDGVPLEDVISISNDQLSSGDANTLLGSSVAGINVDDIESFDILKDASATALYGARAMNGVIVITTKKGKSGKPVVNYTGNYSTMFKPSYRNFNIMNSSDQMSLYSQMDRKGYMNNGALASAANGGVYNKMYTLINTYDSTAGEYGLANNPDAKAAFLQRYADANTNWFDVLFRNSLTQEHSLNISSGSDFSQFYFSTSFYQDNGWALGNNVKRYTANMRGSYKLSPKLSANFITTGSIREQTAPGTNDRVDDVVSGTYERGFDINPYSYAMNTSRTITPYDEKGNLEYFTRNYAPFNILHELDNNRIKMNVLDIKIQGELSYKIVKGLTYNALGNIRYVKTSQEQQVTEYSNVAEAYRAMYNSIVRDANNYLYVDPDDPNALPETVLPKGGFYNRVENSLKSFSFRQNLEYSKALKADHNISFIAGQEVRYADRQNSFNKGFGYLYDGGGVTYTDYRIIKDLLEQNGAYYGMSTTYDRFVAFMGKGTYSFRSKYIFNGTVRYDGSNKLGGSAQARWLPTWTLDGAWNVDAEPFMQRSRRVIDYLKVRASYGLTASMGDATNSTVVLENGTTRRPRLSETETQIEISSLENSELTWEKIYSGNIGVDIGLLKDKVNISIDYYNRRSFDLISSLKTSGIGGQAYKVANYADMDSRGVEFTFGTRLIKTKDWSWRTNLTFAWNTNTITNLKNTPRIYDLVKPEGGALQGHAVRGLYSIQFKGLTHDTGMPTFVDESGNVSSDVYLQSNSVGYLKYEGPIDPTVNGGFSNTIGWKGFTFTFLVSYQLGNKVRMTNAFKSTYSDLDAMPKEFINSWLLPGDETKTNVPSLLSRYQTYNIGSVYPYNNYNYSTVRVADGSFVRLKTVSLTYNLNSSWVRAIGAKNLSVSVTGNNLWLLYADKKLQGQDPEFFTSGGVALPMSRQAIATLRLGF